MRIFKKTHERDFYALKQFNPSSSQVLIDIGSNRGEAILSSILMSDLDIKIIGFEPNPIIFKKLEKKFKNYKNIHLYENGLANEENNYPLFIPFYKKWMFDGLASFKLEEARDWLKDRLWLYDEKKQSIKEVICKIKRLDDFKLKPYFIKIDVQGFEQEVLEGGEETIKTYQPIILIESINKNNMAFLKKFNYDFFYFSNNKFVKGIGELNTFCIVSDNHLELDFI